MKKEFIVTFNLNVDMNAKTIHDKLDQVFRKANTPSPITSVKAVRKGKPKPGEYTDEFLQFWAAYPRKTGKGAAFKVWHAQKLDTVVSECIQALSWQSKSADWLKDNGSFIPHPQTYLNQRRWEDEPPLDIAKKKESIRKAY